MKKFGLIIGCLFLFAVLVSCSSTRPTVNETTNAIKETTTIETVHDTIFKTETDSSSYRALLDCINGKIVVKEVTQAESGRNLKSPRVRLVGNNLSVDCEARAQELFAFWKSKQEVKKEYLRTTRTIKITTNKLTWLQQTQIYGFRLLFVLFACWVAYKYIKLTKFL